MHFAVDHHKQMASHTKIIKSISLCTNCMKSIVKQLLNKLLHLGIIKENTNHTNINKNIFIESTNKIGSSDISSKRERKMVFAQRIMNGMMCLHDWMGLFTQSSQFWTRFVLTTNLCVCGCVYVCVWKIMLIQNKRKIFCCCWESGFCIFSFILTYDSIYMIHLPQLWGVGSRMSFLWCTVYGLIGH